MLAHRQILWRAVGPAPIKVVAKLDTPCAIRQMINLECFRRLKRLQLFFGQIEFFPMVCCQESMKL